MWVLKVESHYGRKYTPKLFGIQHPIKVYKFIIIMTIFSAVFYACMINVRVYTAMENNAFLDDIYADHWQRYKKLIESSFQLPDSEVWSIAVCTHNFKRNFALTEFGSMKHEYPQYLPIIKRVSDFAYYITQLQGDPARLFGNLTDVQRVEPFVEFFCQLG